MTNSIRCVIMTVGGDILWNILMGGRPVFVAKRVTICMTDFQTNVLTLVRYALSPEEHFPSLPDGFPYKSLLKFADLQQVAPLLYYGACKTDSFLQSNELLSFTAYTTTITSHSARQLANFDKLTACFEEAGIDYMPLKGSVLKRLYPLPEMRVMGDCDILIRAEQIDRARDLMKEQGYTLEEMTDHCYEYKSPDKMMIELHVKLLPDREIDLEPYYKDGWWTARPSGQHPCHYEMRPEDHYIFQLAHFVKHFRGRGAGIKFVIDFKVFEQAYPDMDMDYVRSELVKLGLDEFYDNIRRTLAVWFEDAPADEMTDHLTELLFNTTTFGLDERGLVSEAYRQSKLAEASGKTSTASTRRRNKWFELFFLPYSAMKEKYLALEKWAILLPIFWIVRGFDILLFHKDKIDRVDADMEKLSQESVDAYRKEINYVGLDKAVQIGGSIQKNKKKK